MILLVCFRCDGKGKVKNEFGIMEKCESCQKPDMSFEKVEKEPDFNEEGYSEFKLFQFKN